MKTLLIGPYVCFKDIMKNHQQGQCLRPYRLKYVTSNKLRKFWWFFTWIKHIVITIGSNKSSNKYIREVEIL